MSNLAHELQSAKNWNEYTRKQHDQIYLQATYNTVCMLIDDWNNIDIHTMNILKKKLGKQVISLGESSWVKKKPANEKFKKVI